MEDLLDISLSVRVGRFAAYFFLSYSKEKKKKRFIHKHRLVFCLRHSWNLTLSLFTKKQRDEHKSFMQNVEINFDSRRYLNIQWEEQQWNRLRKWTVWRQIKGPKSDWFFYRHRKPFQSNATFLRSHFGSLVPLALTLMLFTLFRDYHWFSLFLLLL